MQAGEFTFQPGIVDIAMDKITVGNLQARQRDIKVSKDDDLVTSIKKYGLLSPVLVKDIGDDRYELVAGQRRYYAHQELEQPTIKARILATSINDVDAKKISFIENLVRKEMKHADCVDTVEWLMERYSKVATVAEELGISQYMVRKYLSQSRMPKEVKEDIARKEYGWDDAKKALDILGGDESTVNISNLQETSRRLGKLSAQVRAKAVKIKKSRPDVPMDEVIKKAREVTKLHRFNIEVTVDQLEGIQDFMNDKNIAKEEDAASELIDIGLEAAKE